MSHHVPLAMSRCPIPREFLVDKRVSWHDRPSTPKILKPRHQRKRPALWYAGRLDGATWCGSETEDLETPAVVPSPPTVPTPSQINWVTGRRLHACTVLGSRESSTAG